MDWMVWDVNPGTCFLFSKMSRPALGSTQIYSFGTQKAFLGDLAGGA